MALFPDSESEWPKIKNHTLLSLSEKQPASQSFTKHNFCVCVCVCVCVRVCTCTGGGGRGRKLGLCSEDLNIPGIVTASV